MDERAVEAIKAISESKKLAIESALKRKEKRKERKSGKVRIRKLGVKDIADVFGFLYFEKYKSNPPVWSGKEIGQCKSLIDKIDYERAEKLVRFAFKNWEWLSKEIQVSGTPQIGDILVRCVRYVEEATKREVKKEEKEESGIIKL